MEVISIEIPEDINLESLQAYLADVVQVVRVKQPKNNEKLWNRLLVESYGGNPSRVFEYIPCKIEHFNTLEEDFEQLFGFTKFSVTGDTYYTNMRELLNLGYSVDVCIELVDFTNYRVAKCTAPYMVYGQISTHTQMTTISHSQRYAECDMGYWKPDECKIDQDDWNELVRRLSPDYLEQHMRDDGVKRREVFARGADMLQNRVFSIGGYVNNPNAIPHFIAQRLDLHTQLETRLLVQQLKDLWEI